jgi:DNA-binding transcriptional regulator YdaS (Cro superfamily)
MATRKDAQKADDFSHAVIHRAAILAASGMTQRAIARELGVSECQVSRWSKSPEYISTKNAVMMDAIDVASARLRALAAHAVSVLQETMEDPKASPADRIRAAGIVIDRVVGDCGVASLGPTDAGVIESKIKAQEKNRELEKALDDLVGAWGA